MNQRSDFLDTLKEGLQAALKEKLKDKQVYKGLLKNLIIQSLIKMMETEVSLKCVQEDVEIMKSVIEEAALEFSNLCKNEIGKEFFTKINIDTTNHLSPSKSLSHVISE